MLSAPPQIPSFAQGFARRGEAANSDPSHGLVGAWHPPLGPTGSKLFDQSGCRRDGTISGSIVWDVGQSGHILSCPGTSGSHIQFANDAALLPNDGPKTYVAHVRPDNTTTNSLFGFGYGLAALEYLGTGRPYVYFGPNNYRSWNVSAWNLLKDGNWHTVAFVIYGTAQADIAKTELWIDGVKQPTWALVHTVPPYAFSTFELGGTSYEYDGQLGMFAVWDRVLTAAEHMQIYVDSAALFRQPHHCRSLDGLPGVSDRPGHGILTGGRM